MAKKKICFVVAAPTSADGFLTEQIILLRREYDVYLAANGEYGDQWKNVDINDFYSFPIMRKISLWKDIKAVVALTRYFRTMEFDAVHSITPKAGLICALASFFANIKHRSHTFTGQVWATRKGLMRKLLKSLDWVTAHLDNHIFTDGEGQRQFLISEGVVSEKKSCVLAKGSICGIRTDRFVPSQEMRSAKRKELGIKDDQVVFIFIGRLNRDKGCYELLSAFNSLVKDCPKAYLLMFGGDEEGISPTFPNYSNLKDKENFYYYGISSEIYNMLQAGDVFVLPTYREGFGVSVIEAQALALPVITSDAYGVVDASVENITGLRHPVGDAAALENCMRKLYENPDLRKDLGQKGRERILSDFRSEVVANAWLDFYHKLLNEPKDNGNNKRIP